MDYSQLALEVMAANGRMMKSSVWPKKYNNFLHGEMFILDYLMNLQGDAMPSELSNAMNASSARVAMALKSLESKGYIERRIDQEDRRKIIVSITGPGKELVICEREVMRCQMTGILTELGERDAQEYLRIITRIAEINEKTFKRTTES
jgi:MarR family transcriptional regulator, organic hydroperoxide resistance regulator